MPTTTAGPATATAESSPIRRHRAVAAALALAGAAALAACGGSSSGGEKVSGPPAPAKPAAFTWLRPQLPPTAWRQRDLPSGAATLAYPGTWQLTRTDPGTVTATVRRSGQIAGYLNITPRGGDETLTNWASFRPAHNREEGDRNLVPLAAASGLRFTGGRGSCVEDSYSTETDRRYTEIACIVRGAAATTVIVGATAPQLWDHLSPTLERAISSFDATA